MKADIPRPLIVSTLFTALALSAFMAATVAGVGSGAWLKMLTSTGFLAMGIAAGGLYSGYGRMILAALCFSWWGDLFLLSGERHLFLWGLTVFLLAHLAFSGAFLIHGVTWRGLAIAATIGILPVASILWWLHPHLGDMRLPVYAYTLVISLMVVLAAGTRGRGGTALILAGALLFYMSDIFVARARFVAPGPWNGYIGLPLYYIAQMLLAWSIHDVNRARRGPSPL